MHLFVHAILHEESFFSYKGPATERKETNSTQNMINSTEIQCLHYFAQSKDIQHIYPTGLVKQFHMAVKENTLTFFP
jgi:hypothetical protein